MMQTIAVDIDDVLAANAPAFIAYGNNHWDTHLTVDDYDEHWRRMWQLDEAALREFGDAFHASGEIGRLAHFEAALPVLQKLHKQYRLVITTSRRLVVKEETLNWIDTYYSEIFDEVHFAGFFDSPTAYKHSATKAELARQIGASYIIDDQLKHCLAAAEAGITALLFGNYSWNRTEEPLPENVVRISTWLEVEEYFDAAKRS